LLRSKVWAIVLLVMRGTTTVFTPRGLPPYQSTPMSGAHQIPASPLKVSGFIDCLVSAQVVLPAHVAELDVGLRG